MAKKTISPENNDRYIEIGLNIAFYRRRLGITQDQLSEKVNITREFLGALEAPNIAKPMSLETIFDLADALGVEPYKLLMIRD